MESHLTEEGSWASTVAARLRLIQANFADEDPASRRSYLTEEIERNLKNVPPSKHAVYLDALAERFPGWDGLSAALSPETNAGAVAPAQTPEALLERLLEMASGLGAEKKLEFARRLQQAGLSLPQENPLAAAVPAELQKKLGLAPDQPLNPERTVKLLAGLLELVVGLDQLVWNLWRQLARQPKFQREADFAKLAGPYLIGDPEVSTQVVAQPLEKTRRLIASLLGAVGRAGPTYAKNHAAQFAPEVIENWARLEKKWNETLEYASWRKYREHYKEHGDQAAIEHEIQEAIVKTTENLILGRAAG